MYKALLNLMRSMILLSLLYANQQRLIEALNLGAQTGWGKVWDCDGVSLLHNIRRQEGREDFACEPAAGRIN